MEWCEYERRKESACSLDGDVDNNLCLPTLLIDNLKRGTAPQLLHERTRGTIEKQAEPTVLDLSQASWRLWSRGGWLTLEVPPWSQVPLECGGWRTAEKVKPILGKRTWAGEQSEGLGFQEEFCVKVKLHDQTMSSVFHGTQGLTET